MLLTALLLAVSGLLSINGSMQDNGWNLAREQAEDRFIVRDGELICQCSPNPMKGVSYYRDIEFPEVGELSYEVKLFVTGHTDRYVLQVLVGEFMMSFSGRSMIRFYPVAGLSYPNWKVVAKDRIPGGTWTKVRIRWNTPKRTIKYYVGDDQTIPSFIEREVVIKPSTKDGLYRLSVGNYGLHSDFETHALRNFEIRAVDETAEKANVVRDTAVVFSGLCSEYFPIEDWTKSFAADKVVEFTLEYNGYNYTTVNNLSLSGYPDDTLCDRARLIILCDMPLQKEVLPYECQEYLLDAVKNGARMLVTGGLAGLERCGDYDSPIAKALPCKFESPFSALSGGVKLSREYGKGKIVILNKRKVREPCIEQ